MQFFLQHIQRLAFACLILAITGSWSNAANDAPETGQRIIVKWKVAAETARDQVLHGAAQRLRPRGAELQRGRRIDPKRDVLRLNRKLASADLDAVLQNLREQSAVEYAVVDERRRVHATIPNDPYFAATAGRSGQWYLQAGEAAALNAIEAWDETHGSSQVVVAVLDTGVRFDHPDLRRVAAGGKLLDGYDFVSCDQVDCSAPTATYVAANDGDGWDADATDPGDWVDATDRNNPLFSDCDQVRSSWHGTRVAGLISAATNNNVGIAGVSWNTRIVPVRVIGKCGGYDSDILTGMRWAAGLPVAGVPTNSNPAAIINVSLGASGSCTAAYRDVIDEIRAVGTVVIASAGNESGPTDSPANCEDVIGVAGLRHEGDKVGFSNLGPEITIAAPAGNCPNSAPPCVYPIDTTYNLGTTTPAENSYTDATDYNIGTSSSAPLVAGVAALMYAVNPHLTPAALRSRLQSSASVFPVVSGTACHPPTSGADRSQSSPCNCTTSTCGAGMVNAREAVLAARKPLVNISGSTTLGVGQAVVLDGAASIAADGNALSYSWTVKNGAIALSNPATQPTVTATALAAGPAVVALTVTDDVGQSSSTDWALTVGSIAAATYSIGGTVSGLSGSGLVLRLNGGGDLAVGANGAFSFSAALADGQSYSVTIKTQPSHPAQTCSAAHASGTVAHASIGDIVVSCTLNRYQVGGTVSGLSGTGLILQNNASDEVAISANGRFNFATLLTDEQAYNVTVKTRPTNPRQTCSVASGSGTIAKANITAIAVSCVGAASAGGGSLGMGEVIACLLAGLSARRWRRARSRQERQLLLRSPSVKPVKYC